MPRMATCHPHRQAVHGLETCRPCFQLAGILKVGDPRPPMILGLQQRAATVLASACPKCGAGPPAWRVEALMASCFSCGADQYVCSERVVHLKRAAPVEEDAP